MADESYSKIRLGLTILALLAAAWNAFELWRPPPSRDDLTSIASVVDGCGVDIEKPKRSHQDAKYSAWFSIADRIGKFSFDGKQPGFGEIASLKVGDKVELLVHQRVIPSFTLPKVWEVKIGDNVVCTYDATLGDISRMGPTVGLVIFLVLAGLVFLTESTGTEGQRKAAGVLIAIKRLIGG